MYLALIEPGSYLDFVHPVPFSDVDGVIERGVLNEDGRISGRAQAAVRALSSDDFDRITSRGLDDSEPLLPRVDETVSDQALIDEPFSLPLEQVRERVSRLSSRIVRDRIFRRVVLRLMTSDAP